MSATSRSIQRPELRCKVGNASGVLGKEEMEVCKVVIDGDDGGVQMRQVHERVEAALRLRSLYKNAVSHVKAEALLPLSTRVAIKVDKGIYCVADHDVQAFYTMQTWSQFAADVQRLRLTVGNAVCIAACTHRLGILQERSRMFFLRNAELEERLSVRGGMVGRAASANHAAPLVRVDLSVQLNKCADAQETLDFIADCWQRNRDVAIRLRNGVNTTLSELLQRHNVADPRLLTVEALHLQPYSGAPGHHYRNDDDDDEDEGDNEDDDDDDDAHGGVNETVEDVEARAIMGAAWCGRRLDDLSAELRFNFLNLHGAVGPRHIRRVLERAEQAHAGLQRAAEYSIPFYAAHAKELTQLATALHEAHLTGNGGCAHVRWVLQLRLFSSIPANCPVECDSVQDQLDHLFLPMFVATIAPTAPGSEAVAELLTQLGALQLEGPGSGVGMDFDEAAAVPEEMPCTPRQNELYYAYYIHANLLVLNSLRRRRGLNTLQLRCVCNHRNDMDNVLGGYLLADALVRATKLQHYPVLQYLCGLHRVGLVVAPLCDHLSGATPYDNHPLPHFLQRCLRVTLATEAPMHFHHNPDALAEEYATAQKVFRLSPLDMAEFARNSVLLSSFPASTRRRWLALGQDDDVMTGTSCGSGGGRSSSTNIGDSYNDIARLRHAFREEAWRLERDMLRDLHLNRLTERGAGPSHWHFLSNVKDVEYNTVLDRRIRFPRTVLGGARGYATHDAEAAAAAVLLARALDLRATYLWRPPQPWQTTRHRPHDVEADFQRKTDTFNEDEWTYAASDAVFIAYPRNAIHGWPRTLPTLEAFHRDVNALREICAGSAVRAFAHSRLEHLDHLFRLHLALNHANEAGTTEERASSNRDIYQATKVDTHIHMAAGMTPKQMLQFVLQKYRESGDDIAMKKGDEIVTLGQLFEKAGITSQLTVDQLNVQADHTLFERFDNFNNKYNPMGNGDLRSLLLKTDNFMNGRYFAELIRDVFTQYLRDRHTFAENRLSIYGVNIKEWDKLAHWFVTHGMASKHNKWIIQVPRVYKVFRAQNIIGSFGQYLQNIFQPLWEASLHPAEHPTLHNFLTHVSGFDSVDNEATLDSPFHPVSPWAWTLVENPPYNYYLYYLYANIRTLNEFRASRGFSTFALRPHCGESGSEAHLYGAFLCANSICHGINLRNDPSMEYLYYLTQIGLHVSPLSNNALFLHFLSNPFPQFFRRGLNVSLSTDDPMMFHQTQEPLLEEYSIAARVWGLSANDLCELARNSVLQCGFDAEFKQQSIGERWYMSSSLGNDPLRTHLSDIRVAYRFETYHTEIQHLERCSGRRVARFMMTAEEEQEINERNLDLGPEEVTLSTHDQAMEVMLRDMDAKREQIRVATLQVEALRRQQRSLVDNITEIGVRRQEREEEERRTQEQTKLHYERAEPEIDRGATGTMATVGSERARRLLRWRPMPPHTLFTVRQEEGGLRRGRPLPPLLPSQSPLAALTRTSSDEDQW